MHTYDCAEKETQILFNRVNENALMIELSKRGLKAELVTERRDIRR